MTPTCCTKAAGPTHCGCFDEVHVRGLARALVAAIYRHLRTQDEYGVGAGFRGLQDAAFEYQKAIRDPRSARAWSELTLGDHPCDAGGWCVNVSDDEMARLAYRLRGPIVATVRRHLGGRLTIAEEATFRLPVMKIPAPTSS